jgi:hypothetical protein
MRQTELEMEFVCKKPITMLPHGLQRDIVIQCYKDGIERYREELMSGGI